MRDCCACTTHHATPHDRASVLHSTKIIFVRCRASYRCVWRVLSTLCAMCEQLSVTSQHIMRSRPSASRTVATSLHEGCTTTCHIQHSVTTVAPSSRRLVVGATFPHNIILRYNIICAWQPASRTYDALYVHTCDMVWHTDVLQHNTMMIDNMNVFDNGIFCCNSLWWGGIGFRINASFSVV